MAFNEGNMKIYDVVIMFNQNAYAFDGTFILYIMLIDDVCEALVFVCTA